MRIQRIKLAIYVHIHVYEYTLYANSYGVDTPRGLSGSGWIYTKSQINCFIQTHTHTHMNIHVRRIIRDMCVWLCVNVRYNLLSRSIHIHYTTLAKRFRSAEPRRRLCLVCVCFLYVVCAVALYYMR